MEKYVNVWRVKTIVKNLGNSLTEYIVAYLIQSDCVLLPESIDNGLQTEGLEVKHVHEISNCKSELDDFDNDELDYVDKLQEEKKSWHIRKRYVLDEYKEEATYLDIWVMRLNLVASEGYDIGLLVGAKKWQFPTVAGTYVDIIAKGNINEVFSHLLANLENRHFRLKHLLEVYNVQYSLREGIMPNHIYRYAKKIIEGETDFIICEPYHPYDIHNIQ